MKYLPDTSFPIITEGNIFFMAASMTLEAGNNSESRCTAKSALGTVLEGGALILPDAEPYLPPTNGDCARVNGTAKPGQAQLSSLDFG